jgi:hypothetical protein
LKGLIEFEIIEHLVLVYTSEGWESNNDSPTIMIDMVALNEWMKEGEEKNSTTLYGCLWI